MWIDFTPSWLRPTKPIELHMPTYESYEIRNFPEKATIKKYKVWQKGNKKDFCNIKAVDVFDAIRQYHVFSQCDCKLIRCKEINKISELKAKIKRLERILKENNITLM